MKTEEEIKKRIEQIKLDIVKDVIIGTFTDETLQEQRDWADALEWVLEEE